MSPSPPAASMDPEPGIPARRVLPFRPTTIFEGEDPTLDPFAIAHALPPLDPTRPRLLTLGICAAIGLLWALAPSPFRPFPDARRSPASPVAPRQVKILLDPEAHGEQVPLPKEGPSGGGRRGNGLLDPRYLLAETAIPVPRTRDADLEELLQPANPSQPLAPRGDGFARGLGPGSGGGIGGGTGSGAGVRFKPVGGPDFKLVAVKHMELYYQLAPGQVQAPCVIVVDVVIEADGRVSSARAVSGPAYLHRAAEAAARQWTFEPLEPHGIPAPYLMKLNFHWEG